MARFTNTKGERIQTSKNKDGSTKRTVLSTGNPVTASHSGSKDKVTGVNTVDAYNKSIGFSSDGKTKIDTIKTGSPVISSSDREGEFNNMSGEIDKRDVDLTGGKTDITGGKTGTGTGGGAGGGTTTSQGVEPTGDAIYDSYLKARDTQTKKAEAWAEDQRKQINRLLPETLANINSTYKSSVLNIRTTYENLIEEQRKINEVDLGRVQAYGIQNLGAYVPLEFTKSVSNTEREHSNQINGYNNERNALLAKAKSARDEGKVGAMRASMEDIRKVEESMQKQTEFLMKEVQAHYETAILVREKKEKERLVAVDKAMKRAFMTYLDDFEEATDPASIDKIVKGIIKESGGLLTPDDEYDIYAGLSNAKAEKDKLATQGTKDALDIEKKRADINNTNNTIYNRNRDTTDRINRRGEDEETANIWGTINSVIENGINPETGNPVVGEDGKINPTTFNELLNDVKEDGVDRAEFLAEYGHLINTADDRINDYKLTQKERDLLQNGK